MEKTNDLLNDEIPFTPSDKEFREVLFDNFIIKANRWLLGKHPDYMLTREYHDIWETGYSILFFHGFQKILEPKISKLQIIINRNPGQEAELNLFKKLVEEIKLKIKDATIWLIEQKNSDNNFTNWDKVTWDTSVVCRSLIIAIKFYPLNEVTDKVISTDIVNSLKWLHLRFTKWESEIKYPFGPADIAQILITIVQLDDLRETEHLSPIIKGLEEANINIIDFSNDIVEYLLKVKNEKQIVGESTGENYTGICWNDFFTTAEVIESLALYDKLFSDSVPHKKFVSVLIDKKQKERYLNLHKELVSSVIGSFHYIEHGHTDGTWGSHMDTLRVLISYVKTKDYINEVELTPEPHITFKAIRWMCDEKQVFSDGSMNHVIFFTLFYAHSLLEVYERWTLAKKNVEYIYDDVLWFSPVRTTPERIKRLSTELKNSELREAFEAMEKKLTNKNKVQSLIIGLGFSALLTLSIGLYLGIISFKTNFQRTGASSDLLSYMIAFTVISITFVLEGERIIKKIRKK